jgi:xylose isomerase
MNNIDKIPVIKYEGKNSKNPLAFHHYNPNEKLMGKTMKEHLKFAMSYWHTINASGTDMFGGNTMDKTFGLNEIQMYKAKADFAFKLMHKLGIQYYCFHDIDVAPEGNTLAESEAYLKEMTNHLLKLQKQYKIKLL